jgi:hypothetical protein
VQTLFPGGWRSPAAAGLLSGFPSYLLIAAAAITPLLIQLKEHATARMRGAADHRASMPKTSAGLLPCRRLDGRLEVFLVHPSQVISRWKSRDMHWLP